ncbi:MAG: gamma-glutamylcyclotransferase [Acidobacteriota bacterium]|nr:gamma-glutamylcyclotransferase [Acidobacteriota bacterium]
MQPSAAGSILMDGDTYLYFAYGSNLSSERLRARVPSARVRGRGRLLHHRLSWHKIGRDGSGKCDIVPTDTPSVVWGVLYDVARVEKPALDAVEGLGIGYFEKEVQIATDDGKRPALTYHANPERIDPTLRPRDWYKDYVVRGAREHGLPADYIRVLEQIET